MSSKINNKSYLLYLIRKILSNLKENNRYLTLLKKILDICNIYLDDEYKDFRQFLKMLFR